MNMKLEVIVLPVSDVDRSKAFYEQAGFVLDTDHRGGENFRVVQVTPPGSGCSISFGIGISTAEPGSYKGLHLVVEDIEAAIAELRSRGLEVSDPFHFGAEGQTPGLHPERLDYGTFAQFDDPDGNVWLLQEIKVHQR
jgi:catechol 2,3-dioxygenase-like lactoylglutathione lyase family enzyme